jgi:hypothetical protein
VETGISRAWNVRRGTTLLPHLPSCTATGTAPFEIISVLVTSAFRNLSQLGTSFKEAAVPVAVQEADNGRHTFSSGPLSPPGMPIFTAESFHVGKRTQMKPKTTLFAAG